VLRATRGVSEVISTIMLNFISTSLVAYFLRRVAVREEGSDIVATREIPESSRIPGIPLGSGHLLADCAANGSRLQAQGCG